MARFKIEATYGDSDGAPVVALEYSRLEVNTGDSPQHWDVLGEQTVTDPAKMTPKRVRTEALTWLATNAAMVDADSFELYSWVRADRDVLEAIAASGT